MVFLKKDLLIKSKSVFILEDPGADSGGEGKSKRAEKYGSKKSKEKARRAPGDNVLPDQFSTVTAVLASDWCQKTFVFFWTLSWAVTSPRESPTLDCKTVRILLWIALSTFWTTGAGIVRGENA